MNKRVSNPHVGNPPTIQVSSRDLARLEQLLESPALKRLPAAQALGEELARAEVHEPDDMPADVVTMNDTVACLDEDNGEEQLITVVYPYQANTAVGKVSVLAPVGSALLGISVGQRIEWQVPGGRRRRMRVAAIRHPMAGAGARAG